MKISIITATYNSGATLRDTLESILRQDYSDYELVIKDGVIRMINVTPPASNTVDRLIDMVPQVIDRVDSFIEKQKNAT